MPARLAPLALALAVQAKNGRISSCSPAARGRRGFAAACYFFTTCFSTVDVLPTNFAFAA